MTDLLRVLVDDGKYEVVQPKSGPAIALRHGEPWRDLTGDKLILSLAYELDEARQKIADLQNLIDAKAPAAEDDSPSP